MRIKRVILIRLLLCVLLLGNACTGWASASVHIGRVVSVIDGDTISLLENNQLIRVRLAEIDAPEKSQAFGMVSKQSLSALVFDKWVRVVGAEQDRYGRLIGHIYVDGRDINAEQVRRGMAWVYLQYSHDSVLLDTQTQARSQRLGLWADSFPTPPWEYRRTR